MDINSQQQTNTFLGGMNTDTSDAMLDNSQYRYAENLRIITNTDSNSGELRLIDGTLLYIENEDRWDEILYITHIREYVVFITRKKKDLKWSIYRCKINDPTNIKLIFGECSTPIWKGKHCDLSIVTNYESENNIKIYIADGIHEIMVLNIVEDMVVENWKASDNIKNLTGYSSTYLPNLSVLVSSQDGQLPSAKVQYAYRLYKENGAATKLSPLSDVLSLYKDYKSGYPKESITGRAVDITLPTIDSNVRNILNRIQIFRINYRVNGQPPEVKLFYDGQFTANDTIVDRGTNIRSISVSEFLSYTDFNIIPKRIESKNNYLFASNIKYNLTNIDDRFKNLNLKEYFNIGIANGNSYILDETHQDSQNAISHAAYRPGETYRFGIIFYDEDGNRSSVFHLADYTIPDGDYISCIKTIRNGKHIMQYEVTPPAIRIRLKQYVPGCYKYEIVRCIRTMSDKRTITLGIIGKPLAAVSDSNTLVPSIFMSIGSLYSDFNDVSISTSSSNIILFASPEYVYQEDDIKNILSLYSDNIKLHLVLNYIPYIKTELYQDYLYKYVQESNFNAEYWLTYYPSDEPSQHDKYFYNATINFNDSIRKKYIDNTSGYLKFNRIYPYDTTQNAWNLLTNGISINNTAYPSVPKYNDFAIGEDIRFKDDVTLIGLYTYVGWSSPEYANAPTGRSSVAYDHLKNGSSVMFPIGTTGKCILLELNEGLLNESYGPFLITVADIQKNATPYGGTSKSAKDNSIYYSFGDILSNSPADNILESGDCYVSLFNYNALHNWYDTTFTKVLKCGTVYSVPLFTDIDLHGLYGTTYNDNLNKGYYIQDTVASFDGYVQDKDAYLYDTAYNAHPDIIQYSPNTDSEYDAKLYDTRVHYSEQKTNGEDIDNWLLFKAMNFLDVDSRYGEITGLKLFKDKLLFWQKDAAGILAVNERVVLQDANETQVTLGTGSVLDRYDYISTIYGIAPGDKAICISDTFLYWWNRYNKEILLYGGKYTVLPLIQTKNVKNYTHVNDCYDEPHLYYNNKYNEVVCSCVTDDIDTHSAIVYNELIQRFTSIYTFRPKLSDNVGDTLLLSDGVDVYKAKYYNQDGAFLFENPAYPRLKYIVNQNNTMTKTYDMLIIGGNLYKGSSNPITASSNSSFDEASKFLNQPNPNGQWVHKYFNNNELSSLGLTYTTPLKQSGVIQRGLGITNREYDYRLNIPRLTGNDVYGGRLRGKTMQCELSSESNSTDFSLQYIITKYRMSWS